MCLVRTVLGLGHALKTLGDQPGSLQAYRSAIRSKPDFGEVYWSMANLKVFRFADTDVAAHGAAARSRGNSRRERCDPLPLRAWQGIRGPRRLRHRLAALRHRQPTEATRFAHDPVAMEMRQDEIRERLQPRVFRAARGSGLRGCRSHLHRRAAALGLDADRTDPRKPQSGRGDG